MQVVGNRALAVDQNEDRQRQGDAGQPGGHVQAVAGAGQDGEGRSQQGQTFPGVHADLRDAPVPRNAQSAQQQDERPAEGQRFWAGQCADGVAQAGIDQEAHRRQQGEGSLQHE